MSRRPDAAFLLSILLPMLCGCGTGKHEVHDDGTNTAGSLSAAEEAERDISAGTLKLKGFGYPVPWRPQYARLLKERLGVHYQVVAGCMVTDKLVEDVENYNAKMMIEISRRFGKDALDKIANDAEKLYELEHGESSDTGLPQLEGRLEALRQTMKAIE